VRARRGPTRAYGRRFLQALPFSEDFDPTAG